MPHLPASGAEQLLARCGIELRTRLRGIEAGERIAGLAGSGIEPRDVREYQHGDDVRRMAWAVTARTTIPHIKTFEEEREITCWVLLDESPSMAWGTTRMTKGSLALEVAAGFALLLSTSGARIGGARLLDGRADFFPPHRGKASPHLLIERLMKSEPTDSPAPGSFPRANALAASLEVAVRTLRKRSLVVVISDFLDQEVAQPLGQLARRNEVVCVRISDRREEHLVDIGNVIFEDVESGTQLEVETGSPAVRRAFETNARARALRTERAIADAGAALLDLRTDSDWVGELITFAQSYSSAR